MKIEDFTYKGFTFEIDLAIGTDWGSMLNKFYVEKGHAFEIKEEETLVQLKKNITKEVDKWAATIPKTEEAWIDLLSDCMVWTGYEDCHIDKLKAMKVLEKYKQHVS